MAEPGWLLIWDASIRFVMVLVLWVLMPNPLKPPVTKVAPVFVYGYTSFSMDKSVIHVKPLWYQGKGTICQRVGSLPHGSQLPQCAALPLRAASSRKHLQWTSDGNSPRTVGRRIKRPEDKRVPICEPWCWNMNPNICPKNQPVM
jgi:hypothetical protein